MHAQKLADAIRAAIGTDKTNILAQQTDDGQTLLTFCCTDRTSMQILLDEFSCIKDVLVNSEDSTESLWVVEGELYFGSNETVP
jgi:hypothetical protein